MRNLNTNAEQSWITRQNQPVTKCNGFDEDEVEYEEVKE